MITNSLTPEQLILIRTFIWNTKLGGDGPFNKAADELARYFEDHGVFINALVDAYGAPRIDAEVDEYGATFTIAE